MAPYLQLLDRNAFGNYRQLLYDITLNPAMGNYLDINNNTKTNPNENYAREVLQLFSHRHGDLLNHDGSQQLDGAGQPIPTYDQTTVNNFARVLHRLAIWPTAATRACRTTSIRWSRTTAQPRHRLRSAAERARSAEGDRTRSKDLDDALDNIFNHPNVGPFICQAADPASGDEQSEPRPMSRRVAAAFNANRRRPRRHAGGDHGDPARPGGAQPTSARSELRPPQGSRAVFANSCCGRRRPERQLPEPVRRIPSTHGVPDGEDPLRPASVFSYYPADYGLPGTAIVAPEFGIFQSTTALKRANFINTMVFSNVPTGANDPNGTALDLSKLTLLAANPNALVQELNHMMMHDSMSSQMQTIVLNAVNAVAATNPLLRAQTALYLVTSSSQFQVAR